MELHCWIRLLFTIQITPLFQKTWITAWIWEKPLEQWALFAHLLTSLIRYGVLLPYVRKQNDCMHFELSQLMIEFNLLRNVFTLLHYMILRSKKYVQMIIILKRFASTNNRKIKNQKICRQNSKFTALFALAYTYDLQLQKEKYINHLSEI